MTHVFLSSLQEHLKAGHISRRDFVKRAAALGFSLPAISAALAACGGDDDDTGGAATEAPGSAAEPTATEEENITVNQNATPTAGESEPTEAPESTEEPEATEGTSATEEATAEQPAATATTGTSGNAGGSVTFSRQEDADNMDPVTQDGNINIWIFMNIYDQLINVGEDGTELVPGLATEWEVSDDGLTYTFHIRSGVKFFDGTDMKVSDIVWSLKRAQTNEESIWTFALAAMDDASAPDDSTVVITLTEKWAPFLADIAMFNASVISQEFAEKVGEDGLVTQTMGTGPFHMQEWKTGETMTLVKNPNYWEEGLPLLDEVVIKVVPDGNSQILQLQGGEIDGIIGQGDVPFNRVSELDQDDAIQILTWISTWNNFVVINTREAPLDDVKVRQAMNYAADKETIIENVLFGQGEFSNSFMPKGALYWNEDQAGYPFDLDQAKQAMSESNHPDGFDLDFQIRSGNQTQRQLATVLKDMWAEIGVNVNILQLESGVYLDNYRTDKFQMQYHGWTNDIIDPDELVSYAILPEQTDNYHTGWSDQEAIDLANEGRETLDSERRREIYYQIQKIHMDAAPWVYLYVIPYVNAVSAKVKDYFHHPMGQHVFKNMYIEE